MATFVQSTRRKQLVLTHVAAAKSRKRRMRSKVVKLRMPEVGLDYEVRRMMMW